MSAGTRASVRRRLALALFLVTAATGITVAIGLARRGRDEGARCGPGFESATDPANGRGARCAVERGTPCPPPLASSAFGCEAPDLRVRIPETTLVLGPSDWEAEGRVTPRTVHAGPFWIDAFEVTEGRRARQVDAGGGPGGTLDAARAVSGVTRDEAAEFCAGSAGRLPTEDEWIVAAVAGAATPPRYPWGDTGAVCRRAAWGLGVGPCALGGEGPDTVGAHPDGDSPLGVHDLAGNVAEWVAPATPGASGAAKGGSWQTALATELRVWARLELPAEARDPRVGFRCVYPG